MDQNETVIKLSGFVTAAMNHNNNTGADWQSTAEETEGVGYSKPTSMAPDSILGVQFDATFNPVLTGTIQVVSRNMLDNTSTPQIEWANLQYTPTPNSMIRVGRMANNTFLYSESRLVGFVHPTIHLPYTYMLNPADQINGIDYNYFISHNDIVYSLGANYGVFNRQYDIFAPAITGDIMDVHARMGSLHFDTTYGDHSFRMTYEDGRIDIMDNNFLSYRQGLQGVAQLGIPLAANEYNATNDEGVHLHYMEAAYTYNGTHFKVVGEWVRRDTDTLMAIPSTEGTYVTLGYDIDHVMSYVQVDCVRQIVNTSLPALSGGGSGLAPVLGAINAFNTFMQSGTNRTTFSGGFRWNPLTKLDLKLQYDYIIKPAGYQGGFNFVNPNSNFINDRQVIQLYSAAIDFVF